MAGRTDDVYLADENHRDLLRRRLRAAPGRYSVPSSLPVLFFGDVASATVATIGLNPSNREYAKKGQLLREADQRFETLESLGARTRAELTDEQCDIAIARMVAYFQHGKPVFDAYFKHLTNLLNGFGTSYRSGDVVHLDLVQEATDPTWSALEKVDRTEQHRLLATDLPFLIGLIEQYPLDVLLCTGATVSREVRRVLNVSEWAAGQAALLRWWTGVAEVSGRHVCVAGWNLPLHRPTGLGTPGEIDLGRRLQQELSRTQPPLHGQGRARLLRDVPEAGLAKGEVLPMQRELAGGQVVLVGPAMTVTLERDWVEFVESERQRHTAHRPRSEPRR